MPEIKSGLADDAHPHRRDEFLRFQYGTRDPIDVGAELGAKPARKQSLRAVRNSIIVESLLMAWDDPSRWMAYARDKNWYSAAKFYIGPLGSHAATMWTIKTLVEADLIEHEKTCPSSKAKARSRCRPTDRMLVDTPIQHVNQLQHVSSEPVRLKDRNKTLCPYRETKRTRSWRRDINAQNEALAASVLQLNSPGWTVNQHGLLCDGNRTLNPESKQYYRVFNVDWQHGGRWYGGFWQGLSGQDRGHLLIDGQSVLEIDYPHLHPTLLAAGFGVDLGAEDPYFIEGFPRRDVKLAFNALLNASGMKAAVLGVQSELQKAGRVSPRASALELVKAVKQRHPAFAYAWATGVGLRLQCIDGQICAEVQETMRNAGHPVLSVHDSFIVEAFQKDRLQWAMDDTLARFKHRLAQGRIKIS